MHAHVDRVAAISDVCSFRIGPGSCANGKLGGQGSSADLNFPFADHSLKAGDSRSASRASK
jgi:hypothetical protein